MTQVMDDKENPLNEIRGAATYFCERCSAKFVSLERVAAAKDLVTLLNHPAALQIGNMSKHLVHGCPDGGAGIAHLIGLTPEEQLKPKAPEEPKVNLN